MKFRVVVEISERAGVAASASMSYDVEADTAEQAVRTGLDLAEQDIARHSCWDDLVQAAAEMSLVGKATCIDP